MKKKIIKLLTVCLALSVVSGISNIFAQTDTLNIYHSSIGDVNGDDDLSLEDLSYFSGFLMGSYEDVNENADISCDGIINIADYIILKDNMIRSAEFTNEEKLPLTYEDQELVFMHFGEEEKVLFDATEQRVFNKLNNFREKYGVNTYNLYRMPSYACDMIAEYYYKNKSIWWPYINIYASFYSVYLIEVKNNDPEEIYQKAISTMEHKGVLLNADRYLCIGHYEKFWVIMNAR